MSRQGLRSAECSQPQPRSMGNAKFPRIVHARPPSRGRASTTRQSTRASMSRRPAAIPAAPPPTITTSVSLLATRYSAAIWIETYATIERPIVPSQRCAFMWFHCRYCRHAPEDSNGLLRPQSQRPLARSPLQGFGNPLRLETLTSTLRNCARNCLLRPIILIIAAFVGVAPASVAPAQPTENTSPEQGTTCPPDVKGEPPTGRWQFCTIERQTRPIERRHLPAGRD